MMGISEAKIQQAWADRFRGIGLMIMGIILLGNWFAFPHIFPSWFPILGMALIAAGVMVFRYFQERYERLKKRRAQSDMEENQEKHSRAIYGSRQA